MKREKLINVAFGTREIGVRVPARTVILSTKDAPPAASVGDAVESALERPVRSPPLRQLIASKGDPGKLRVVVAVSDITRSIPYKGRKGLLAPLLKALESSGIERANVSVVIAAGMHRPSTPAEKISILGRSVLDRYRVVSHDCEDAENLVFVGRTRSGTGVSVNRVFLDADIRICTGLVEPHFMAGFSGGRKTICPGLTDRTSIQRFHGPEFLENPKASNLVLEGNPCHEEALEVARKVRPEFILNVTLNRAGRVSGVYAGDFQAAHLRACAEVRDNVEIGIKQPFDVVLTHGGLVGRNHYQAAKAACNALPALQEGGTLIVVADNCDAEPVGGDEYRTLLHLLKIQGPDGYVKILKSPGWQFTKDQWEPEMWGKVLRRIGPDGLVYCSPGIPKRDFCRIPGRSGYEFVDGRRKANPLLIARDMVQGALRHACKSNETADGREPSVAFISEGPHAVPVNNGSREM